MKRIVLVIAALAFGFVANAQIVTGLQGGFYMRNDVNSKNADYSKVTHWLGGAQVGYMVTPKLCCFGTTRKCVGARGAIS